MAKKAIKNNADKARLFNIRLCDINRMASLNELIDHVGTNITLFKLFTGINPTTEN